MTPACLRCYAQLVPRGSDVPGTRACAPRGLCWPCYRLVRRDGTLTDYPRRGRPRAELLAEYAELRDRGYGRQEIPRLLGMTEGAVERALQRARADGLEVA